MSFGYTHTSPRHLRAVRHGRRRPRSADERLTVFMDDQIARITARTDAAVLRVRTERNDGMTTAQRLQETEIRSA